MITYFFSRQKFSREMWPHFAAEFRDNGAHAVVQTHDWAEQLPSDPVFDKMLSRFLLPGRAPRPESVQNEVNARESGISLRHLCDIFSKLNHIIQQERSHENKR